MNELISQEHITRDSLDASPRMRINRSTPLTLSTSWQTIDFNGTSANNVNTFPTMPNSNKSVWYDAANKRIMFNQDVDRNYSLTFYYNLTATLTGVDVHFRFCIPSPTPYYFPFPDTRGYKNLALAQSFTDFGDEYNTDIYADAPKRQYGIQLQIRQAASLLNMPALANSYVLIYGQ